MRVVVAGNEDEILGFGLAGLETCACPDAHSLQALIRALSTEESLLIVAPSLRSAVPSRGPVEGHPTLVSIPAED